MKKHLILLSRDEEFDITGTAPNFTKAQGKMDSFIQEAHSGVFGIGIFKGWIYEIAPEGHIEKCVLTVEAFSLPLRAKETAKP